MQVVKKIGTSARLEFQMKTRHANPHRSLVPIHVGHELVVEEDYPSVSLRIPPYPSVSLRIPPYPSLPLRIPPYPSIPLYTPPYPSISLHIPPYPFIPLHTPPTNKRERVNQFLALCRGTYARRKKIVSIDWFLTAIPRGRYAI